MFLEERLSLCAAYGAMVTPQYDVDITETQVGNEYRRLRHPYPRSMIELDFPNRTETVIMDTLLDLLHRSGGKFGGFRFQNWLDYSSNGRKGTPTYDDQLCTLISAGIYQLTKWYGTAGDSDATRRRILKPVSDSVVVGVRDDFGDTNEILTTGTAWWTVDITTGQVSFAANVQRTVTDITQASQAVVTVGAGHSFAVNDSVHFSGADGMTQINGRRGIVQSADATTITVNINTTAFDAFVLDSSNTAVVNTRPQANEVVTAGYTYDLPVRFLSDISAEFSNRVSEDDAIMSAPVSLIELLNPDE